MYRPPRWVPLLLAAALTIAIAAPAAADSSESGPGVSVEAAAKGIPDSVIQLIRAENPDAGHITIHSYQAASSSAIAPYGTGYFDIQKTMTAPDAMVKDDFIISVAKGQEVPLGYKYFGSITTSANGGLRRAQLGLNSSVSVKISATTKYSGPPESSPYNSRSFRIKYLENRGTYTAKKYIGPTGMGWAPLSGNWNEASSSVSYSIDSMIQP